MSFEILPNLDISDIFQDAMPNGSLLIKPAEFWHEKNPMKVRLFMHQMGVYVIPTQELIDHLEKLRLGITIEIGCGIGAIGRALNIPITDSKLQADPTMKAVYELSGQPPIVYPNDVEGLTAMQALSKYKPNTVIGAYITHKWKEGMADGNMFGVDEDVLIKRVRRYIMVGNRHTHRSKPILRKPHDEFYFPWLITRAQDQALNRIFVWNNYNKK